MFNLFKSQPLKSQIPLNREQIFKKFFCPLIRTSLIWTQPLGILDTPLINYQSPEGKGSYSLSSVRFFPVFSDSTDFTNNNPEAVDDQGQEDQIENDVPL